MRQLQQLRQLRHSESRSFGGNETVDIYKTLETVETVVQRAKCLNCPPYSNCLTGRLDRVRTYHPFLYGRVPVFDPPAFAANSMAPRDRLNAARTGEK
jgi:hypothetical protein